MHVCVEVTLFRRYTNTLTGIMSKEAKINNMLQYHCKEWDEATKECQCNAK